MVIQPFVFLLVINALFTRNDVDTFETKCVKTFLISEA